MRDHRHHTLTIADRGGEHRHRWSPSCSCGWVGVPRRRIRGAADEYRLHRRSAAKAAAAPDRPPRQLTPADKLPEELRA